MVAFILVRSFQAIAIHTIESLCFLLKDYGTSLEQAIQEKKASSCLLSRLIARGHTIETLIYQLNQVFGPSMFIEFAIGSFTLAFTFFSSLSTITAFLGPK